MHSLEMQHVRTQGLNPHEILKSKNGALNPFSSLLRRFFIMSGPRNLELGIIIKARSLSLKSSHWLLSVYYSQPLGQTSKPMMKFSQLTVASDNAVSMSYYIPWFVNRNCWPLTQ